MAAIQPNLDHFFFAENGIERISIHHDLSVFVDGKKTNDPKIIVDALLKWTKRYGDNQLGWKNMKTKAQLCDCGAKHTSSPNMHADWCSGK